MKERSIRVRLSQKRNDKLKAYAQSKEKTVTQLVEDWIDRLPSVKIDAKCATGDTPRGHFRDFSTTPLSNQSDD